MVIDTVPEITNNCPQSGVKHAVATTPVLTIEDKKKWLKDDHEHINPPLKT